jgi:aminopeptidase N
MKSNLRLAASFITTLFLCAPLLASDRGECELLHSAGAAADRTFDAVTGRDIRNYPPDPQVNYQHMTLDLRMRDPMSKSFECDETLTFHTPMHAVERIDLNAVGLGIKSITDLQNRAIAFRQDDQTITLNFSAPLPPDTDGGVKIAYACTNPKQGMTFALPDDKYKDRPVSIHTQGETETNRYWFVSHDYPNVKMSTEILATIPSKYSALSNGALVEKKDAGGGMTQWHYRLDHPHVPYLVSLVIGEFAVVTDRWRGKPVEYWVPPKSEANARRTFGRTPEMLELFSNKLGFEYPWEKYAQSVVFNFGAGGMENTSCTTLVEMTDLDERAAIDSNAEGLIAHELGHQWFGDTLTCRGWQHIWLNEGFATYMDETWQEHAHGAEAYAHEMWRMMQGVAENDDVAVRGGVVWPYYNEGFEAFGRTVSNPYRKGASVLHMLRISLGDDLFWKTLGEYLRRNQFKCVETDDLRKVCDELSGRSYEQFFQQWIYRPGSPHIKVGYEWAADAREARITLEQTQQTTIDAPAFSMDVPVWLVDGDGSVTKHALPMNQCFAKISIKCDREPKQIAIDPQGAVLAKWDIQLAVSMLLAQATAGSTPRARYDAIAALATHDRDDVRASLKTILLDEKQHYSYRSEAAAALGKMHQDPARDILIDALAEGHAIKEPRTRKAAVSALGDYRNPKAVPTLLRFAKSDETYTVEAAASEALGKQDVSDQIVEALIANCAKPSYRDQIRTSAVKSLADLGAERGLQPAMALAGYGQPFRSRPMGIEAVGKIGETLDKKDEPRKFLLGLVNDPQDRAAVAAIRALGELGDEKAIGELKTIADGSAPQQQRDAARSAIDAINKKSGETATVKSLRERIESLEKSRAESEKHKTTLEETKDRDTSTTRPAP